MTEYLELYNTAWGDLMRSGAGHETTLPEYGNRSIQTTWTVSFEGVKKKNEDAAKMLQVWSYLDNKDIWFEMFINKRNSDLRLWSKPPEWFRRVFRDKLSFKGVAATLLAYSLIEARQDSESYGVHPVVHEWCRNTMTTNRKPELAFLAITSVAFGVPDLGDRGSWPTRRRMLQHASQFSKPLMDMLEEALESEQRLELHCAFWRLGSLYRDGGQKMWVEAEVTYRRAISGFEKTLGLHHEETLSALEDLATLYSQQERFVDAEALLRHVVAIRTKKLGPDHTSTMLPTFNLANVLSASDKLAEAEPLYQVLLKCSQMDLDFNKNSVFVALGILYNKQGKLTESEAMYLQAFAGYKTHLETDHPRILWVRYNLGLLYEQENRLVAAEATILQVLEGSKRVFGVDHQETLDALALLGRIFEKQRKFAEAEAIAQQALAGYRLLFGSEHESTLRTFEYLAMCYFEQEKFADAEGSLLQALESFKHIPDDQKTSIQLDCIDNLGIIYIKLGRQAEAEAMFQQALTGYRLMSVPEHNSTLRTLRHLRICYQCQGRSAEADSLLLQCLESFKHVPDDQKTSTHFDCMNDIGRICFRQMRLDEAEEMLQQALLGYRRVLGSEHKSTLRTRRNLRICYQRQGKFAEAATLFPEDTDIERHRGHNPTTDI